MLHRLAVLLIVGFWLAMTGLLVVRELYPEATRLNQIPVHNVGDLMFQHKQPSYLDIYNGDTKVGDFHFEPKFGKDGRTRTLEMNGNLTLELGGSRQRFTWNNCTVEFDGANNVSAVRLDFDINEPGKELMRHLRLHVDNKAQTAHYLLREDDHVMDEATITLDQAGMAKVLERFGLEPTLFRQLQAAQQEAPKVEIEAQESSTSLNGEKLSTYLTTMKVGGQTVFDAHVGQLGVILRASIPLLNYHLVPPKVAP
jgi:hypothetical protein